MAGNGVSPGPGCGGRCVAALAAAVWVTNGFAQAPHYPGAWVDGAATRQELAGAAQRGVASATVYGSNDRVERVDAFYRQYFQPLPAFGGGAGYARFCLDRVDRPEACRRYVEVGEAGGGSRISVYELR